MPELDEILTRRVAKVLPDAAGLQKLMSERPIKVYQGFDPTGTRLHIGHAIGLKKLAEFAEAGHEVTMLFGTGTVLVGDPSQRDTARKKITQEEIDQNIASWKEQVSPIIDFNKVKIQQNGDWITKMTIHDVIDVASNISATQLFKRESFTRRIEQGDTVWYHETMYPLLQGYDSVVMDVDLEIGGTDQEFNMLMGRELQKKMNNKDKYVLTVPMILGTDGKTMSKSSGNCVWLADTVEDMYGKLMATADSQIADYLWLCTDLAKDEVESLKGQLASGTNPKEVKARMALEITAIWHDRASAESAQTAWEAQFSGGELPSDIPDVTVVGAEHDVAELLTVAGMTSSKSEGRRLLEQGGVKLNREVVQAATVTVNDGDILQAGKRRYARLRVS